MEVLRAVPHSIRHSTTHYQAGILHVASAGNQGVGDNTVGFPARYGSAIAVAATDKNNNRTSFSSTGLDVELAAPGVSIYSTLSGGGYGNKSGTSMAAPHVAGVAALVMASGGSNVQVRQILRNTADDLGNKSYYGYGLVKAVKAVGVAPEPDPEPDPSPAVYTLTVASTAGGMVTQSGEGSFTYQENTLVPLQASPTSGYRFVNRTGPEAGQRSGAPGAGQSGAPHPAPPAPTGK